jgi:hypothetical protein
MPHGPNIAKSLTRLCGNLVVIASTLGLLWSFITVDETLAKISLWAFLIAVT